MVSIFKCSFGLFLSIPLAHQLINMIAHSFLGLALVFFHHVSGRPLTEGEGLVEHETTPNLPAGWQLVSTANDNENLDLRIALRQPHQDYLEIAQDVSNPLSANYGKYLSVEDLAAAVPSTSSAAQEVISWLNSSGVNAAHFGEWVDFRTTVGTAQRLFNANFSRYSHLDHPPILRTQSYSIPHNLSDHIDFLYPATQFLGTPRLRVPRLQTRQRQEPSCELGICPQKLTQKYNITYTPPDNTSGATLAIAGFLEQYPSPTDLTTFLSQYGLNHTTANFTTTPISGAINASNPGVEAMLDTEYTTVFTGPLPVTYLYTSGRGPQVHQPGNVTVPPTAADNEPYLVLLTHLLALPTPPQVLSISYSDDESSVPRPYALRVCDLFARLAARGVSVLVASGDGGAQGTGNSDCLDADARPHFVPTFPSSCPWVTSVGATALWGGAAGFSSGGFSDYFPVPEWQHDATRGYVAQDGDAGHEGLYNASGRGIPDTALVGDDFVVVTNGMVSAQDGTSASTPVVAAMVALVNDLRLRRGQPVLGFLNPLLYAAAAGEVSPFRDVVEGWGEGCADATWSAGGWDAREGWDPVTGLGELNFEAMVEGFVGEG